MNNEPVAWMDKRTNKCVVFINTPPSDDWIPLYTHPVKEPDIELINKGQELLDKPLGELKIGDCLYWIASAVQQLKKAQE